MRFCVPVAAFCILNCCLADAGWVDLSANIPWPNDSMDLSSVYFIGDEGWVSASYWGDSGFVFHTTDGGQTFEVQHTQYPAYSVHMVTRLDGYACGQSGRVYRTTDGGANWSILGTIGAPARCIDFPPGCDTGYCCGDNGHIARVTPAGVTQMTSGVAGNLRSISFPVSPRRGWVCGGAIILLCQRDTWAGHYSYPYGAYNSICFVDSFTGWAFGDMGLIVHTDGDANFVPQANPDSLRERSFYGSSFIDSNSGWVVGFAGIIERTTDGGQNWRIEAGGMTDHFLRGVFAVDTGTAYVVGNLKAFLKYDGRGGVEETTNDERGMPGIGPTFVRGVLRLPVSPFTVHPSLFDMTGRQVMALHPGPNDVSRLAPGVYSVGFETPSGIETRRLILAQ